MTAANWLSALDSFGFAVIRMLVSLLWQSSILISVSGILVFLLRRKKESVRHSLLVAVILIVPVLPFVSRVLTAVETGLPHKEIPVLPGYSAPQSYRFFTGNKTFPVVSENSEVSPEITTNTKEQASPVTLTDYPWFLALTVYSVGLMYFLMRILSARVRIKQWITNGEAVIDERVIKIFGSVRKMLGLQREILVVGSLNTPVPFTFRIFKPVVLLPEGFAGELSDDDLKAVAVHELSHVKRNDAFITTLVSLIRAVFFFHPLIWVTVRQISYLAELACDNAVLEMTGEPETYAGLISRIAEDLPHRLPAMYAVGIIYSKSVFYRRIKAILSGRRNRIRRLSKIALAGTVGAAILSVVIALALPLGEKGKIQETINDNEEVIVSGTVLNKGDEPVSNADIYVFYSNENKIEQITKTDSEGSFSIAVLASAFVEERLRCPAVIAYRPEYSIGWKYLGEGTDISNLIVQLQHPVTITGTITDDKGQPIKDAEARLYHIGFSLGTDVVGLNPLVFGGSVSEFGAKVDEKGRFTVSNLPDSSSVALYCVAPGYAYEWKTPITAGTKGVPVILKSEGRIEGTLTSSIKDAFVKDIRITAQGVDMGWAETKTGDNGHYVLTNIPQGFYNVFIWDDLHDCTAAAQESVRVETGKTVKSVDLKLVEGGFITGKVIDKETGKGIQPGEHSVVAIYGPSRPISSAAVQSSEIKPDGTYKIRVAPGNNYIYIMQLHPWTSDFDGPHSHWVDVKKGETVSDVNFYMKKRNEPVVIEVLTSDKRPVDGAIVHRNLRSEAMGFITQLGRTNKEGLLIINRYKERESFSLMVELIEKKLRGFTDIENIQPGDRIEITVNQYETTRVQGRIIDDDSNPLSGAIISLYEKLSSSATPVTVTDNAGEYTISELIVGDGYGIGVTLNHEQHALIKTRFTATKNMKPLEDIVLHSDENKSKSTLSETGNLSHNDQEQKPQESNTKYQEKRLYTVTVADLKPVGISIAQAGKLSDTLKSSISHILTTVVYDNARFEYVNFAQPGEVPADFIVLGSAGLIGDMFSVNARLVHTNSGRIIDCADRQYKGSVDEVINTVIPAISNDLFPKNGIGLVINGVEELKEGELYTLAALTLEAKGVSNDEAEILSENIRYQVFHVLASERFRNQINRDQYIMVERAQMGKILEHYKNSGAPDVEFGSMLSIDRILVGSIGKIGGTYSITARIVDVEAGKTVGHSDIQLQVSIDKVMRYFIDKFARKLFLGTGQLDLTFLESGHKGEHYTLAVLDLESVGLSTADAGVISEWLRSRLYRELRYQINQKDNYTIIEPAHVENILEQAGSTEFSPQKIGKLLDIDKIVFGMVKYNVKTYSIEVKLVDVETGETVKTVYREHKGSVDEFVRKVIPGMAKELIAGEKWNCR